MTKKKDPRCLLIFVRRPELGKVKTRLAAEVGEEKALDIYIQLLDHTRNESQKTSTTRHLWYTEQIVDDEWSTEHFKKYVQPAGDLGHKMKTAFAEALSSSDKAIIIGSDCPQLSTEIIEEAFVQLDKVDVVLGPTFDGGYYLLGMKTLHTELFDDMEWSTSEVLSHTIKRVKAKAASYHLLPTLSDVDYKVDWDRYGWES